MIRELMWIVAVVGCAVMTDAVHPQLTRRVHDPISAVEGLLNRLFPRSIVGDILLDTCAPAPDGSDAYELDYDGPVVVLRGSSGTALASAVNHYLNQYCHVQLSWNGDTLNRMPAILPSPLRARIIKRTPYSYYQNVCTVSYSSAWWSWKRWEREIDWMALNGINMPLAFTGQEYVWQQTWKQFGLSAASDLNDFWSGPAFYAWQRMGNIQGWGGPLPQSFIDAQYQLQLQILSRMAEFGMIPVLPAFAGHVPRQLKTLYPNANITQSANWANFPPKYCCVDLLESTDPLFAQIGKAFITTQRSLYGALIEDAHLYQCDTFNEMVPRSSDPAYLKASSAAVYNSMASADPQAVWLMQNWLFVNDPEFWHPLQIQSYLSAVPNPGMIILDLYSDVTPFYQSTNQYYGKSYIFCQLHNFGGNLGLYGRLGYLSAAIPSALAAPNSTLIGMGLTMEGINQNYVVYDYVLKMNWELGPNTVQPTSFINQFVYHRYGTQQPAALLNGWQQLLSTVYNSSRGGGVTKSMIELKPGLQIDRTGFMPTQLFYDAQDLVDAWQQLWSAASAAASGGGGGGGGGGLPLTNATTYRYDVIDVTRQILSDYFLELQHNLTEFYTNKQLTAVNETGNLMLGIMSDLDRLLASDSHFLVGSWIGDAKSWSTTPAESALYEFNARNQITLWGPTGEIMDYASKSWSGLVGQFYYDRWQQYLEAVVEALQSGVPFDQSAFDQRLLKWQVQWQTRTDEFPTTPIGDTIEIAGELYQKYCPLRSKSPQSC